MARWNSPVGQKFNRLTVIKEVTPKIYGGKVTKMFLSDCDCGNDVTCRLYDLRSGRIKSCGCWRRDSLTVHGFARAGKEHPLYSMFNGMRSRCYNPNNINYSAYGRRGISIYQPWLDYPGKFFDYIERELGPKPSSSYSIERIDVDGNYEPGNLRWATETEQRENRQANRWKRIIDLLKAEYPDVYDNILSKILEA